MICETLETGLAHTESVLRIDIVELNPYYPRPFVFSDVARCMRDGLRNAGLLSDVRHTVDTTDAPCILLGSPKDLMAMAHKLDPSRTAITNFEQLGSDSKLADAEYCRWLADWAVVDYHSHNIEWLQQVNGLRQRVFEWPLMPSASVAYPAISRSPAAESIDVLFYGSMTPRRSKLLEALSTHGLRVEVVRGAYGHELAPALARARLVLHVHYYTTALFPVARVLQPVARGVPVVCEQSHFSLLSHWDHSGIAFASYDGLLECCLRLLADPQERLDRVSRSLVFAAQPETTKLLRTLAENLWASNNSN